jgi:hypothetical protein
MNDSQSSSDVLRDVVIPEADHTVTLGLKPTSAFLVTNGLLSFAMLRPIDFDQQLGG